VIVGSKGGEMKYVVMVILLMLLTCPACNRTVSSPSPALQATITRVDIVEPHPTTTITDSGRLDQLLFFFGDIRNDRDPETEGAAWEAKFKIDFKMKDGSQISLATSHDDKDWSTGKGDRPLKPGLSGFLDPMLKKE
jgi:hypothetical protein